MRKSTAFIAMVFIATSGLLPGIMVDVNAAAYTQPGISSSQPLTPCLALRQPTELNLLTTATLYDHPSRHFRYSVVGEVSPQTVQVSKVDFYYPGNFLIHTWLGERWIHVNSQDYTLPLPKNLKLWQRTALYKERNALSEPVSYLDPQTVTVLDADPDWYYPSGFHEFRVAASSGQSGWVKLYSEEIGAEEGADITVYVPDRNHIYAEPIRGPYYAEPIETKEQPYFAKARSCYWNAANPSMQYYEIETAQGFGWITGYSLSPENSTLPIVTDDNTELKLSNRTMAFRFPRWENTVAGLLEAGTRTALRSLRLDDKVWYEVDSQYGKVWVQERYADPADAVEVDESLVMKDLFTLSLYPNVTSTNPKYYSMKYAPQTLHVTARWKETPGNPRSWLQVDAEDGKAWLRVIEVQEPTVVYSWQDGGYHSSMLPKGTYLENRNYVNGGTFFRLYGVTYNGKTYGIPYKFPLESVEGYQAVDTVLQLTTTTPLQQTPDGNMPGWHWSGASLSPQTVNLKGKWESSDGRTYGLLDSYAGEAWIALD